MQALISPLEPRHGGFRVADVAAQSFEVAEPFFWVDCDVSVQADTHYYDATTEQVLPVPTAPGPTKQQRIDALLTASRFSSEAQLIYFIENARTVASLKLQVSDAQAHTVAYAGNPMYRQMVDLAAAIKAIKDEA